MILLPFDSLPNDNILRSQLLQEYFTEQCVSSTLVDESWSIDLQFPNFSEYYIDPNIMEGLAWWQSELAISEIPFAVRKEQRFQLSLNDSWTLLAWSQWLSDYVEKIGLPSEIIILHVDDHDDLMSPRIWQGESGWSDAITGKSVNLLEPDSISNGIRSGAIGIGSFIVPLLHAIQRIQIRHLCATSYSVIRQGWYSLNPIFLSDTLLSPNKRRLAVELQPYPNLSSAIATDNGSTYIVSADLDEWLRDLPNNVPILLHIDMDYFNNRFNGDSDWKIHTNCHDPSHKEIEMSINAMFDTLYNKGVMDKLYNIAVALSPRFFPAEFWETSIDRIRYHLNK